VLFHSWNNKKEGISKTIGLLAESDGIAALRK
jgi:hypothetical protein